MIKEAKISIFAGKKSHANRKYRAINMQGNLTVNESNDTNLLHWLIMLIIMNN